MGRLKSFVEIYKEIKVKGIKNRWFYSYLDNSQRFYVDNYGKINGLTVEDLDKLQFENNILNKELDDLKKLIEIIELKTIKYTQYTLFDITQEYLLKYDTELFDMEIKYNGRVDILTEEERMKYDVYINGCSVEDYVLNKYTEIFINNSLSDRFKEKDELSWDIYNKVSDFNLKGAYEKLNMLYVMTELVNSSIYYLEGNRGE